MIKEKIIEIKKENIVSEKGALSYLQIVILVIGIFAFAYLIGGAFKVISAQEGTEVKGLACCEKTKEGATCQYGLEENCNKSFPTVPTQCEYVDYCKPGCCYSEESGWCNKNTPELLCQGGKWTEDAACNIKECSRGCCVIGRNAIFTTQKNCEVKSSFFGLKKDFRPEVKSEIECIFLAEKDEEGACVYGESCTIATKESCKNTAGTFYKGKYCSDPSLKTECKAHDHAGCFEQKVYWYDSCGNREEVKEECSIFAGTTCGLVGTDYKCKSINCEVEIDGKKVTKKNGESWCEYEGTIGEGRDVVGSRHYRHVCFMGEERIEPCQDYRNQICVQSDTPINGTNGTASKTVFSEAACRVNNWRQCLDYNTDKAQMNKKCKENPDCMIKNVDVDKYFQFSYCTPKYPPGFDLTNENSGKNAELVCGMGSQRCTVVYVKSIWGKWEPKANEGCTKAGFTEQMNDFCASLGDCGAKANVAGEVTDDGYAVSRAPRVYFGDLKKYAQNIPGQKAEPGDLSNISGGGDIFSGGGRGGNTGINNALGVYGVAFATGITTMYLVNGYIAIEDITDIAAGASSGAGFSPTVGGFMNVLAVAGAIMAGASIISLAFGVDYGTAIEIAGALAGGSVAVYVAIAGQSASLTAVLTVFWWAAIVLIVIYSVLKLLGVGDSKKKTVTFTCLPWQPPTGGSDCSKCGEFSECSQYKCQSLGQGCKLINAGTEQQRCVDATPNDVSSPKIKPLYGVMTEGFEYFNVKNDVGFEIKEIGKDCIPEFTNVIFGIEADRPAQCKIGTDALQSYDDMTDYFGGSNLYLENHTNIIAIPSKEALINEYNITPVEADKLGDINFYVRCRGVNGKANDASYVIKTCVKPGPDITPPYITKASPANNGFIAYNAESVNATFWTNEPANCSYSLNDNWYESLENQMQCNNSLEDNSLNGYPCSATLDVFSATKFYVKCRDLSENNNTMTDSYIYELQRSQSELRIILIDPENGEIIRLASEPASVTLEVATAGGAEDGKAICSYKFTENATFVRFRNTDANKHKQVFSSVTGGDYNLWVECEDVAGNKANGTTSFTVYIDTSAPLITRVYYQNGLKIATDEDSTCAYSTSDSKCSFDLGNITEKDNAKLMTGIGKEHTGEWQAGNPYYIKCMDDYGNQPGRCSMIVRPYELLKKSET